MWWLPPSTRATEVSDTYIVRSSGEKARPFGWIEHVGGDRHLARRPVDAVDEAAGLLGVGLVALGVVEDPVRRVGEPDRPIRRDDDVIGRVEPPALEPVDDGRPRAVALVARDPAQAVLAGEDGAVVVERVAVREVGRLEQDRIAIGVGPAADRVAPDIAPQDGVLVGDVDGALGPAGAIGVGRDRRAVGDQAVEARVEDDPGDRLRGTEARLIAPPRRVAGRRADGPRADARPDGARGRARS